MMYEFEVWQDGMMVAAVSAEDIDEARRETWHYAMVYGRDGPVEIKGDVQILMEGIRT